MHTQVKQLKHLSHCLEQEVRTLKHSNKDLETSMQERVRGEVVEQLKKKHQVLSDSPASSRTHHHT